MIKLECCYCDEKEYLEERNFDNEENMKVYFCNNCGRHTFEDGTQAKEYDLDLE